MTTTTTVTVRGMTCGHCVNAVEGELSGIPGVTAVHADLDTGRVDITSDSPVEPSAVAAAVEEAGYELVS